MVGKPYQLTELLQKLQVITRSAAHAIGARIRTVGEIAHTASGRLPGVGRDAVSVPDVEPGGRRDLAQITRQPRRGPTAQELKARSYELFDELAARLHEK
ncbi:hypothetical protein ACWCPQ_21535 [Nocardia sp. NPDC001965]